MKNFFLKFFITITILIFLPIIYLSVIGIETESFNEQIKNKIKESDKNLRINLKKINLKLDPLRLKFNAKTVGATVYYLNKSIELCHLSVNKFLINSRKKKKTSPIS